MYKRSPNSAEPQQEIEENPNCDIPKSQILELENSTPEEPNLEQENPGMESTENPVKIEVSDHPTSKLSLPPYIGKEDLSISILKEKERKQTEEKPEKRKAGTIVRFQFLSIFPETREDNDWQFFGWVAKEYGLDNCIAKLEYMREHRKQHSITNPKGFFRMSLVKDYQLPTFVQEKIKANEKAKRAKEKSQKESEEWRERTASFNYEGAAASLT